MDVAPLPGGERRAGVDRRVVTVIPLDRHLVPAQHVSRKVPLHVAPIPVAVVGHARSVTDADGLSEHHLLGFDLWSVTRFSVLFYLCVLAVLVAGASLMVVAVSMLGLVDDLEHFMRGIGFTNFEVLSEQLLVGLGLVAGIWFVSMLLVTVTAAALYNVLARWFGGISVVIEHPGDDFGDRPVDDHPIDNQVDRRVDASVGRPVDRPVEGERVDEKPPATVEAPVLSVISWQAPETTRVRRR